MAGLALLLCNTLHFRTVWNALQESHMGNTAQREESACTCNQHADGSLAEAFPSHAVSSCLDAL